MDAEALIVNLVSVFDSAQFKSAVPVVVLIGVLLVVVLIGVLVVAVVAVVLGLVGVESMFANIMEPEVLRLCFLVVVAGVLIGVLLLLSASLLLGVGNNLETDEGFRRCFFPFLVVDLMGVR